MATEVKKRKRRTAPAGIAPSEPERDTNALPNVEITNDVQPMLTSPVGPTGGGSGAQQQHRFSLVAHVCLLSAMTSAKSSLRGREKINKVTKLAQEM